MELKQDGKPDDIVTKVYSGRTTLGKPRNSSSRSGETSPGTDGRSGETETVKPKDSSEDSVKVQLEDSGEIIEVEEKFLEQVQGSAARSRRGFWNRYKGALQGRGEVSGTGTRERCKVGLFLCS